MALLPFGSPPAKSRIRKNSAGSTFVRKRINLIEGTNITLTIADDAGNNEIDVTIAAGGGGSVTIDDVLSSWYRAYGT